MKSKAQKFPFYNSDEELQKFLIGNLGETLKQSIRVTVKVMIKDEMELLRKEISEKLQFNGYYQRNMMSTLGKIDNIDIPRFRQNVDDLKLNSLNIFEDQKNNFFKLVQKMHLLGISQRKIDKLCRECFGQKFSKNRVGKIYKELASKEELNINGKQLDDDCEFLLLDGIYEIMKNYGLEKDNKCVLLCALIIRKDGSRNMIAFKNASHEDFESWKNILVSIKERGLLGNNMKLIISDDNEALHKALKYIYPGKPIQNCIIHKMRNCITRTSFKNKREIADDIKEVFRSDSRSKIEKLSKDFCRKWFVREERAIRSFQFHLDLCFTYLDFDKSIWTKIRTSNILEREFREVRRRIKVFDCSFNSPESVTNYHNTIFDYLNNNYPASLHTES
jgi:transposase-like protein